MLRPGQLLCISEYETLFNLIGTTYGGDGQSTFALPDLRGRLPIHQGNGFTLAETGGAEDITLTVSQIPAHTHPYLGTTNFTNSGAPTQNFVGQNALGTAKLYSSVAPTATMAPTSITATGGSQPHTNFQPYLCIDFIISLFGVFPSQT